MRRHRDLYGWWHQAFNPRIPRGMRQASMRAFSSANSCLESTHRRRQLIQCVQFRCCTFNPHIPRGMRHYSKGFGDDLIILFRLCTLHIINPRIPYRMRLPPENVLMSGLVPLIHASPVRCDFMQECLRITRGIFNPRISRGMRPSCKLEAIDRESL